MVIVAMAANENILLYAVRVEASIFVLRNWICFQELTQRCQGWLLRSRAITSGIGQEKILVVDLDVDVRLLSINVIFDDKKSRRIHTASNKACAWWRVTFIR
jgi:hypothetical protein